MLPRTHSVVYYSLLEALGRYDPDALSEALRELRISGDSLIRWKEIDKFLSERPVRELISLIADHPSFLEISRVAGQSAFSYLGAGIRRHHTKSVLRLALRALQGLIPHLKHEVIAGKNAGVRVKNSPFAVSGTAKPTCGFVAGFLTSAFISAGAPEKSVAETLCASVEPNSRTCLFEVSKSPLNVVIGI